MLVVKIGGSRGVPAENVVEDVAEVGRRGEKVILVHGCSHETNLLARRLGLEPRFFTSPSGQESRHTDRETLEVVIMAGAGKVNKFLVAELQRRGVNAVGVSGLDGRLLAGPRKKAVRAVVGDRTVVIHDDCSARLEQVNGELLDLLLGRGYTPVVSSVGLSHEGSAVNFDADRVAAAIAGAVRAEALVLLTNTPGLLRDVACEASVVAAIPRERVGDYAALARGGMRKKLLAAQEALAAGVSRVIIGDGRRRGSLLRALAGKGTVIA